MNKTNNRTTIVISATVFLFIAIILFFLSFNKTTLTSEIKNDGVTDYLFCNTSSLTGYSLIKDDDLHNSNANITIKFHNDSLDSISFEVSKKFLASDKAEKYINSLHANFDIYTGKKGIDKSGVTPTYSHVDNIGKMTIFIHGESISNDILPLVLIESEQLDEFSLDSVKKNYEKKGFTCIIE